MAGDPRGRRAVEAYVRRVADLVRAPVARTVGAIRGEWSAGRLSLAGLAGADRALAVMALFVIGTACASILWVSLGGSLPGGGAAVPGRLLASRTPVTVPAAAVIFGFTGMAVGMAVVLSAAAESPRRVWKTLVVVVLILAALGGLVFTTVGGVQVIVGAAPGGNALVVPMFVAGGVLCLVAAALLPILLLAKAPRPRFVLPIVASLPLLLVLASVLLAAGQHGEVEPWAQAQFVDYPSTLHTTSTMFGPMIFLVGSASGLLGLIALWQVSTWSRLSARQVGFALARRSRRWWWLLAALLGAKVTWLALGIAGLLPPPLGGAAETWSAIRSDGLFAWLHVAALTAGAGAWLLLRRGRIDDDGAERAAGFAVLAFAALALLLSIQPLLSPVLATIWAGVYPLPPDDVTPARCLAGWLPQGLTAFTACLATFAVVWQSMWWATVIVVAFVLGAILLWRRPGHSGGIFLVVMGLWALPRAIDSIRLSGPPQLPGLADLPALNAAQPETLDVTVTILVAILAVGWWIGLQRRVGVGALLIVLAATSLLIHAPTFAPPVPVPLVVALPIAFPVIYELAFDSEKVNAPHRERRARVLAYLGGRALALTLLATLVAVNLESLGGSTQARLGFLIFGIPLAAMIVAATVPARRPTRPELQPGRTASRALLPRLGLVAAAAGGAVVLLALVAGSMRPVFAALYITAPDRLAELDARSTAVEAELETLAAEDPSGASLPAGLGQLWERETAWLADHPAPGCAAEAWKSWREVLDDYRELGVLIAGTAAPPAGAAQTEIDAVQANAAGIIPKLQAHEAAFQSAFASAREACDGI